MMIQAYLVYPEKETQCEETGEGERERETERQKEEGVREHVLNFKTNVSRGATPDSWAV
jgi:hypothetical protein